MFYNTSKLNDIRHFKQPSKLFEMLIQPDSRGDYPYWKDIWEGIQIYRDYNCHSSSEYFLSDDKFKEIEDLGLDYNHRDAGGNNFFQYVLGLPLTRGSSGVKGPVLNNKKYILSKTKDISTPNDKNRNILFDLMSYSSAGVKGEQFFDYLKKYPELDIHIVDKGGKNLLFEALIMPAPFEVINHLIKNGVSLKQVDKEGVNLLHLFFSFGDGKESNKLFDKIFESLDNIAQRSRYGQTFIDFFIECVCSSSVRIDERKKYNHWLNRSLDKIVKGEFNKTKESMEEMAKTLQTRQEEYNMNAHEEDCSRFDKAIKALNYFVLDMEMEKSNEGTIGKKLKI
jgi:hypothetical protein